MTTSANVSIEVGPEDTVLVKPLCYLGYPKFDEYQERCRSGGCEYDPDTTSYRAPRTSVVAIYEALRSGGFTVDVDVRLAEVVAVSAARAEAKESGSEAHLARIELALAERDIKLYPFQRRAVKWLFTRDRALLGDEMGCIDGDAEIRVNRGGRGFRVKLRDAVRRSLGEDSADRNWNPSIPTDIRALCDGELRLNRVRRFVKRGVKTVVKLTLESGKSLRLTPDHEIAVMVRDKLVWRRADKLRRGARVLTNGKWIDKDGYVRVGGLKGKHPRWTTGGVYEHILVVEKKLGRSLSAGERVHHKNGDRDDNRPANLEVFTASDHAKHHGRSGGYRNMEGGRGGKGGLVQFVPLEDQVVSVRRDGETDVYDIVCENPHRNFVANGIIVHNCGKTPELLCSLPANARALICVPASLKYMWKQECEFFRPDLTPVVLKGRASFRWPEPGEAVIFNYELLPAVRKRGRRLEIDPEVWPELAETMPNRIHLLADEAHYLKNGKAKRSQKFRTLSQAILKKDGTTWLATGTPMMRAPTDLWHVLRSASLELDAFRSWPNFCKLFKAEKGEYGYEWGEPDPTVPALLQRVMMRRLRIDVLPDLPPKTRHMIPVDGIDRATRKACDEVLEALDSAGVELSWAVLNTDLTDDTLVFRKMAAARAALAAAKIKHMQAIVESFEEQQEPLVVFCSHRSPIDLLGERPGWAKIVGGVDPKERARLVKEFQAGRLNGIAATIGAGGVGLTLTRANHLLQVQLDFNPASNHQAEDRICRVGQEADNVCIHIMVADHELDERVTQILIAKQKVIEASMKATEDADGRPINHLEETA